MPAWLVCDQFIMAKQGKLRELDFQEESILVMQCEATSFASLEQAASKTSLTTPIQIHKREFQCSVVPSRLKLTQVTVCRYLNLESGYPVVLLNSWASLRHTFDQVSNLFELARSTFEKRSTLLLAIANLQ